MGARSPADGDGGRDDGGRGDGGRDDGGRGDGGRGGGDDGEEGELAEMLTEFDELEALVDSPQEREQVRAARAEALEAVESERVFGKVIRHFDRSDAAEALLGSILFGLPMLVEGGTFEVGEFLATRPGFFAATALFGIGMVTGILYVADIQDVRIHEPLLGFIPRRLAGVVGIAVLTAAALATAWGRVDWGEPVVATAQVTVIAVPMAIGGALGDILPGT